MREISPRRHAADRGDRPRHRHHVRRRHGGAAVFGLSATAWGGYRAGYLLCAAAAAVGGILLARPQRR